MPRCIFILLLTSHCFIGTAQSKHQSCVCADVNSWMHISEALYHLKDSADIQNVLWDAAPILEPRIYRRSISLLSEIQQVLDKLILQIKTRERFTPHELQTIQNEMQMHRIQLQSILQLIAYSAQVRS